MDKIKKILILSTSNPYKTAGVAAYDILKGFKKEGYFVKLLVENYDKYEDDITCIQGWYSYYLKMFIRKIKNAFLGRILRFEKEIFTKPKYHFDSPNLINQSYKTKKILKKAGFRPDVIIVVFAQYFLSFKNLFELQNLTGASIYWQLADENAYTGGCHYAWDCSGFENLCENCPALYNNSIKINPREKFLEKLKYIKKTNITLVIGSDWLIERVKKSTIFKSCTIKKIYLSVDSDLFKPVKYDIKQKIRNKYFLDIHKTVILIIANYLDHERKGIRIILNALNLLEEEYVIKNNLQLLIIGNNYDKIKNDIPNKLEVMHIKSVERNILPEIYNLSDIFVSASIQDVGPYTITESLLCGIPVVALDHGYAREFVINYITGILVYRDKPQYLKAGIMELLDMEMPQKNKIKKECRNRILSILSKESRISEYIKLINENK